MTKEEVQVREIFYKYLKVVHILKLVDDGYLCLLEDNELNDIQDMKKFKKRVDMTLRVLKPIAQLFITNCFVKKNDTAWWFGIYSRSTYYRLRKDAIQEFMYYFNL